MARYGRLLTDAQWEKIRPLLPKRPRRPRGGRPPANDRKVLEGILWILRSGARWQDLPDEFPSPATCWRRLRDWEERGIWLTIWRAFLAELNFNVERLDCERMSLSGRQFRSSETRCCQPQVSENLTVVILRMARGRSGDGGRVDERMGFLAWEAALLCIGGDPERGPC